MQRVAGVMHGGLKFAYPGECLGIFLLFAAAAEGNDQHAPINWGPGIDWQGLAYSVLRNSAIAMASIAAPMMATMAKDSPSGTTQPNHETPGLRTWAAARELTGRWLK